MHVGRSNLHVGSTIAIHSLLSLPCRYTGYIQGLAETYAQTPIPAQLQTKHPATSSFLFTRTYVPPVSTPSRDPCNFPDTYKPRHEPANLWPQLQTKGERREHSLAMRELLTNKSAHVCLPFVFTRNWGAGVSFHVMTSCLLHLPVFQHDSLQAMQPPHTNVQSGTSQAS